MTLYTEYYILIMVLVSWMVAQIIKLTIEFIKKKKFDFTIIVGAGGMPSVHSATVVALACAIAKKDGFSSTAFAIALVLAFVVIYDSMNVRFEAGEHAKALNALFNWIMNKPEAEEIDIDKKITDDENKVRLEEKLGHTALEVSVGIIVGILPTLLLPISF